MKFSICIPSYNRARHLAALLDSILSQDFNDYEVVICEDLSPERLKIRSVVDAYAGKHGSIIKYIENEFNHGYDANIRRLISESSGDFCFFMGNDDVLCEGALSYVSDVIERHPGVGVVVKSYAWFDNVPEKINQEVRYFNEEKFFAAGSDAVSVAFRRSGVISGYIVRRDAANRVATDKYDGTLYYQMHLTASVLATMAAVFVPKVLVLCRNGEPPDFGNSKSEKGKYVPGQYTPNARLNMISGALRIAKDAEITSGIKFYDRVVKDYALYFYPYIKDQFDLPFTDYFSMYKGFLRMGFGRYFLFHVYFVVGYLIGSQRFDMLTRYLRAKLGRSPHFGI